MDTQTLDVYNRQAPAIVARHLQFVGHDSVLKEKILEHLYSQEATADIGSGSGRDTAWLRDEGFPVIGYDGSEGMLAEARRLYPDSMFHYALLPHLSEIPSASYRNVLCSFVLMHLPTPGLPVAIENLARILQSTGRLVVAFRPSRSDSDREGDGRLFTPISLEQMQGWMEQAGMRVLLSESYASGNAPDSYWHILVGERLP